MSETTGLETVTEVTHAGNGTRFVTVFPVDLAALTYREADGYTLRVITGRTIRPEDEEI